MHGVFQQSYVFPRSSNTCDAGHAVLMRLLCTVGIKIVLLSCQASLTCCVYRVEHREALERGLYVLYCWYWWLCCVRIAIAMDDAALGQIQKPYADLWGQQQL
jgi:hypothetical protein